VKLVLLSDAIDPRHLVYAVLALQDELILPPADYTFTVEQVFVSILLRLLEKDLDLLG
jgi:hypothetical protein